MNNICYKKIIAFILSFVYIFSICSINTIIGAETIEYEAPIYKNKSIITNNDENNSAVLLNEEFTIKYTFQPQPIPAENIPLEKKDKEIVLILDTSGSMKTKDSGENNETRLKLAKESAESFLNQLIDNEEVKVSLISYSNDANLFKKDGNIFFSNDNFNKLYDELDSLSAKGGTNIGLAMYEGYKVLNEGEKDADKYFIFLTDGIPTLYSYYQTREARVYYTYEDKSLKVKTGGTGRDDLNNYCLNYAKAVGEILANDGNINSYFVAFADEKAGSKLSEISSVSNGHFSIASTGDALKAIYEELGEQISSDISIKNIYFEETFPDAFEIVENSEGLTVDGNIVKGGIGSINYNLNDEGTYYVADTKEFTITLKAKEVGTYILGENNSSFIRYEDINGEEKVEPFEPIEISVYETLPPNIQANLFNSFDEPDKYTLIVNINELAKLEIYNIYDELIDTKEVAEIGDNFFELTAEQLIGTYLKVKAIDQFENYVIETVPIIKLKSLILDNKYNLNNNIDASIEIVTQLNSTINKFELNDNIIDDGKLVNNEGIYKEDFEVKNGLNKFMVMATNSPYGNSSTWYYSKEVMMDNVPPIISHNLTTNIFYVKPNSDGIIVYVESDGTGSKIAETHYKKLEDNKTTADVTDFSDVIGTNNDTMDPMSLEEIENSIFADNKDNEECKHEKFSVNESGYYAVYAKDEASNESVIVIEINIIDNVPELL